MPRFRGKPAWLSLLTVLVLTPRPAFPQVSFDVLGARALGMGGAFVAVSDDATAGHWNPAGLVAGPPVGVTIGWDAFHFRDHKTIPVNGAGRVAAQTAAVGSWPLGISFVRVAAAGVRTDASGSLQVEALKTSQIGFTVLQSITDYGVVGATLKFVRGAAAIGPISAGLAGDVLDDALDAASDARTTFDLDVGVSAGSERFRAAATFKNLRRPGFGTIGGKAIHLERRARLGLAAFPRDGLTLAIDVDLDTADPLVGLRRTIALGGETRLGVRLTLRGGIRWQRSGDTRPIGALGGSLRIRPGLWLDGYVTRGQSGVDQGFGISLRAGS